MKKPTEAIERMRRVWGDDLKEVLAYLDSIPEWPADLTRERLEELARINSAWKAQQFHLEREEKESEHWMERAERAEAELAALREQLAEKDKMLKTMRSFFNEYALGPLAKPSCLCCGRNDYKSVAVQHAELPGIVVCDQCKHAEMQLAERDAEIAALKGHAEAMALDLEYIFQHDDASGGSEALPEYRAAYPKED